jgi:hypothetical protein
MFKFGSFFSPLLHDSDFEAKPSVLLLGQYSTGRRRSPADPLTCLADPCQAEKAAGTQRPSGLGRCPAWARSAASPALS